MRVRVESVATRSLSAGRLQALLGALLQVYGPQGWWPGDHPFEVMVGAILTQNTAWKNVERAIAALKANEPLAPESLLAMPAERLAARIRPVGYFNLKAARLHAYCSWYLIAGGYQRLQRMPTAALRAALLSVRGVGPETADDILLYAFSRPVFVIDAYTRRILTRLGYASGTESYEELRRAVEAVIGTDTAALGELHALLVAHGKERCRPRPRCDRCPLSATCPEGSARPPAVGHAAGLA